MWEQVAYALNITQSIIGLVFYFCMHVLFLEKTYKSDNISRSKLSSDIRQLKMVVRRT